MIEYNKGDVVQMVDKNGQVINVWSNKIDEAKKDGYTLK